MKKLVFLVSAVIAILCTSCAVDDSIANLQFEFIPTESIDIPNDMNVGEIYTISVTYQRPTVCHEFSNFQYFSESEFVRNVAVIHVVGTDDCDELTDEFETKTFNFSPLIAGTYTFKFWQGRDVTTGDNLYLITEVNVEE